MTKEAVKRERELMRQLRKATTLQEVLDLMNRLEWDVTREEALEYFYLIFPSKSPTLNEKELKEYCKEFYATEERMKQEAILQKMFDGTLTPEEIEAFFPKD